MRQLGLELTFCHLKSDTWPWCNCVSLLHLRFLVSIKLTNEIIDLLESESVMAECNLLYRLNWIKDLQEHVHYLENQKNLKEQKIYSLSKIF